MAPLKRLRKASDKSTEATTVTEVATMKKRSREVEESSNALQVSRRIILEGTGDIAHLTVISNLQVALKVIYNKLQKGIDQFEASIFGDFTRMKIVQFYGGFVHHLLLRQLYNDDPHVIEFEFNRVGARFDRKAFAMFTRLNCGKFPKETEMRNLSYSLWTKLVKKNNFTIIENDNLLEKYPWGNLCYDLTIFNLRSKMEAGKHKTSYSLYGFPFAFQYIMNNELIPTEEELQKTYMINFLNIDWASEMNDTPFSEYYAGKMPLESSSWAHKDIVYIPVNNNGAHWLTAKVDIPSRHITLYDSAIKMTPKLWFQIKNVRPLAVLFPYLLMVNEYYSHHPDQMLDLTPFRMTREEDSSLPQQISDGDCGVYALKYIEYFVAGRPFDFNSSHIALFREKYAVEIFHNEM
ncbi:hypothetical protein FNV43_RR15028 [Rhamnella rubrinervis]|uniref:Ubiquitin-like protease family profile domain-containing protein n=1 Tax=Rhamnella rubrinervis TaxID=2594499 RepID=A0A8K0GTU7_9ROSA|nr:hypothetical protein FNV43_RR15028 [Rhamnella rubrinervis]